jgi:UDP-glucose 4-epimerase
MKIIVTGGAGFIGSHIVDKYMKLGHSVVVIDNLSTGSKKNLNNKAKFYKADINDFQRIQNIFLKERPGIVNHHAAIAEVSKSLKDPAPTIKTNLLGTINILRAVSKLDIKKLIFASTGGAMYGNPKKNPVSELALPNPLSPYGLSKLLAEECIKYYANNFKFNYIIFRYANVYGPRQNTRGEAGVVAIFSYLMKHDKRPHIFGDGTKTRDYVYVKDVANANAIAIGRGKNEILNLGTGEETTDKQVYETIARKLSFTKEPIYKPFRDGEIRRIALDRGRVKKILGWEPKTNFSKGTKNTVPYI